MRNSDREAFATALSGMLDFYGAKLTAQALDIWWHALKHLELAEARQGLMRHTQNEQHGRFAPKPADVIREVQAGRTSGRPGPEEAWAMVPKTEEQSALMTAEMAAALATCADLADTDLVAARVAFKESYAREVQQAVAAGKPVEWRFSAGWAKAGRITCLAEAVQAGRLTCDDAARYAHGDDLQAVLTQAGVTGHPLLESPPDPEQQRRLASLLHGTFGGTAGA